MEGNAGIRRRTSWLDLGVCLVIVIVAYVASDVPVIAIPAGLLCVLLVPGYGLCAAIFPANEQSDVFERIGLAFALSFSVIAIQALVLHRVPDGLTAPSIRVAVSGCAVAILGAATWRRARLKDPAPPPSRPRPVGGSENRAEHFTQAIVVASVVAAGIAYAVTVSNQPARPTAFFILGSAGRLADYPGGATVGEPVPLRLGVEQTSDRAGSYQIVVLRDGAPTSASASVQLRAGERWEGDLQWTPDRPGADQELAIELRAPGDSKPIRTLRIWLNVAPASSA